MKLVDRYREQAVLGDREIAGIEALSIENSEKDLRVPLDNILRVRTHVMRDSGPRTTLDRPIFITGLPRSGCAFLHNLLAQIEGLRAPELWEARYQSPARHFNQVDDIRRIRATRDATQQGVSIRLAAAMVGGRSAVAAVSDSEIMMPSFWSMNWGTAFRWQAYFRSWLAHDRTPSYAYHQRVAERWAYFTPHSRMVFRDNWHLWDIGALRAVYPDAQIVHLRRDLATCMNKLHPTLKLLNPDCGSVEELTAAWQFMDDISVAGAVEVSTDELSNWPLQTVGVLGDALGIPLTNRCEEKILTWIENNYRPRNP